MISLELAQKLKAAGLEWKINILRGEGVGDWYYGNSDLNLVARRDYFLSTITSGMTWAPRLDQLLAEIEARGYEWIISNHNGGYNCSLWQFGYGYHDMAAKGDTPEDAAAKALLWVLERDHP